MTPQRLTHLIDEQKPIMSEEFIEIGTIISPHGLKGEVKIYTESDFPERFETPGKRFLQRPNTETIESLTLQKGYSLPGKNLYIVNFKEITDRNQAEDLRQSKLFVGKDDRPQLEDNEYHVDDLINLRVINQKTGENIGKVIDIYAAGNDLLVVELATEFREKESSENKKQKQTILIPFVADLVPIVKINEGQLEVNLPVGLLEL